MKLQDVRGSQLTAESKSALISNALTAPRRLEEDTLWPRPGSLQGLKLRRLNRTQYRLGLCGGTKRAAEGTDRQARRRESREKATEAQTM
jgi:hypothetical protein